MIRTARHMKRAVRRAIGRSLVGRVRRPAVSIVMPVYNVEHYLGACLESVLEQDFTDFELLLVDDGSTDGSARIATAYAQRDRRIVVIRQANTGQGLARNLAVARARGQYLVFVDSDDLLPPGSLRYLVSAIRRSGSDFVVAGVRRREDGHSYRPSWSAVVHEHDRVGVTIDDFPAAMLDAVAHHRIIAKRFWLERIGGFPSGIYEDHVPMVAAYVRSRRFDVLSRVTYEWRLRADGTSTGQQKHDLKNLRQRIRVKEEAREMVWSEGSPAAQAAWVGRVLDIDLPAYLDHALRADDAYRDTLQKALARYLALADADALAYVRVAQKVRTWLASRGAWSDVDAAQQLFHEQGSIPPTMVVDTAVRLQEAFLPSFSTPVPTAMLELSRGQTRLQVCLVHVDRLGAARLRLVGWAVVRAVDLSQRRPSLALTLMAADGSRHLQMPVAPLHVPGATEWVGWPHGSFERSGFEAEIDLERLREAPPGDWHLHARVEIDELIREGGVHYHAPSSAGTRPALAQSVVAHGVRATSRLDRQHGFTIRMEGKRPGHQGN